MTCAKSNPSDNPTYVYAILEGSPGDDWCVVVTTLQNATNGTLDKVSLAKTIVPPEFVEILPAHWGYRGSIDVARRRLHDAGIVEFPELVDSSPLEASGYDHVDQFLGCSD